MNDRTEQIETAERMRINSRTPHQFRLAARWIENFVCEAAMPDEWSKRPKTEKTEGLMALAIARNATLQAANASWMAPDVVFGLTRAQQYETIYQQSVVKSHAESTNEDTRGRPYDFDTEAERARIKYALTLAHLTGSKELLDQVLKMSNDLVAKVIEEGRDGSMLRFERQQILLRKSTDRNEKNTDLEEMKDAFERAIQVASEPFNAERVYTLSSWMCLAAVSQGDLLTAAEEIKRLARFSRRDKLAGKILIKEVVKNLLEGPRHLLWQLTGLGRDYSSLMPE